jgi:hypothetical protein
VDACLAIDGFLGVHPRSLAQAAASTKRLGFALIRLRPHVAGKRRLIVSRTTWELIAWLRDFPARVSNAKESADLHILARDLSRVARICWTLTH